MLILLFTILSLLQLLTADRHVSHDFSAGAFGAVNRQGTANLLGALAHANQSEMTSSVHCPPLDCQNRARHLVR